jgi:hypothetical protein
MSDDKKTTPPSAGDGGSPACGTTTPCPSSACQCGDVRWVDTQAYCGDNAKLQATFTGTCPDGPATVEILNSGTSIATINSNLQAGRVDAVWIAKAPTANWRTDRIRFRVRAAGQTCQSSNEFTFRQRPTTDWVLKNVVHASGGGFAPSHEKHDARLEADRVHYSIKLKTHGLAFAAAKQTSAKNVIENEWNGQFGARKFHRTTCSRGTACDCAFDCCKCGFHLDVNFVASGEHVDIEIVAGPARSSMNGDGGTWGDPSLRPLSYAHETGHLLGQADEYSSGAFDPTGVQPNSAAGEPTLMGDTSAPLLNRHFRWVLAFLNANASGDPYETIPR